MPVFSSGFDGLLAVLVVMLEAPDRAAMASEGVENL